MPKNILFINVIDNLINLDGYIKISCAAEITNTLVTHIRSQGYANDTLGTYMGFMNIKHTPYLQIEESYIFDLFSLKTQEALEKSFYMLGGNGNTEANNISIIEKHITYIKVIDIYNELNNDEKIYFDNDIDNIIQQREIHIPINSESSERFAYEKIEAEKRKILESSFEEFITTDSFLKLAIELKNTLIDTYFKLESKSNIISVDRRYAVKRLLHHKLYTTETVNLRNIYENGYYGINEYTDRELVGEFKRIFNEDIEIIDE